MVDRIIGNKGLGPLNNVNRTGKTGPAQKNQSGKSDRVDFSSALQNATKAQQTEASRETARAERIQELKAQIDNGTYQPDLDKVAASLLPFIMKDS